MFCSVSTGKSGSSWLDRLRNAKGFTDDGATDLENFLPTADSPNLERSEPRTISQPEFDHIQDDGKQLFSIMSDVLNELFNFGENCSNSTKFKKSARKQANPRICAFSSNSSDEKNNAALGKAMVARSGDGNSGVEGVKVLAKREDERDGNLSGFSRTEVTVIDTSYEVRKFEKLLYRKKNVWKVRDKKGKSESMGSKKKRKLNRDVEENQCKGKKQKIDEEKGCKEELELLLNAACHQSNNSEANEQAPNDVRKVLKKKQADSKLENGSSSIILIKSIHTSKKNGTSISKNSLNSKQSKP